MENLLLTTGSCTRNRLYPCIAFIEHRDKFDLNVFKFGLVGKSKPTDLDREESRFCTKFKTNVWGLNRMEIKT